MTDKKQSYDVTTNSETWEAERERLLAELKRKDAKIAQLNAELRRVNDMAARYFTALEIVNRTVVLTPKFEPTQQGVLGE